MRFSFRHSFSSGCLRINLLHETFHDCDCWCVCGSSGDNTPVVFLCVFLCVCVEGGILPDRHKLETVL